MEVTGLNPDGLLAEFDEEAEKQLFKLAIEEDLVQKKGFIGEIWGDFLNLLDQAADGGEEVGLLGVKLLLFVEFEESGEFGAAIGFVGAVFGVDREDFVEVVGKEAGVLKLSIQVRDEQLA